MPRHSRTSTAPRCTMRDGAAATADPSARSSVNSSSRRRVEGLRPPKAFSWRRYAIARVRNDRLISRDGALPNMAFQRSRISSVPSFDRLAISDASAPRPIEAARRFMIVSLDISRLSNRLPSSYVVLLEAGDSPPDDTHIARFAARSQSCRGGRFRAMSALTRSRLLCRNSHSPSNRPDRCFEPFASSFEAANERLAIGHHDSGVTAENLRWAGRQMELAAADVDPHVGWAGHQKGIARQAESGDVEDGRLLLVGDRYVDVFQRDDVAEVFGGSIKSTLHGSLHPRVRPAVSREPRKPRLQYLRPEALRSAARAIAARGAIRV